MGRTVEKFECFERELILATRNEHEKSNGDIKKNLNKVQAQNYNDHSFKNKLSKKLQPRTRRVNFLNYKYLRIIKI